MAKRKNPIIRIFGEGIREGVQALVRNYWPLVLPVLTGAAQYFEAVPLPYFFAALSVAVACAVWAVIQIRLWRDANRLDDKITVELAHVRQTPMDRDSNLYMYQLLFGVVSLHKKMLFVDIKKITWEVGPSRPKEMIVVEEDIATLPPGHMITNSPTIENVPLGDHSGKFTFTLHYGPEQDDMQYEVFLSGTFRLLEAQPSPVAYTPFFRWNRMKFEVRKL